MNVVLRGYSYARGVNCIPLLQTIFPRSLYAIRSPAKVVRGFALRVHDDAHGCLVLSANTCASSRPPPFGSESTLLR